MQTEAVLKESTGSDVSGGPEKDPKLLGVSLPVSTTIDAALQVKNAWAEAITAVIAAAKTKAKQRSAAAKTKVESATSNGASEISA